MIQVHFFKSDENILGFSVSGHAGYADFGEDIACASVTSAVQLTANAITDVLRLPADLSVKSGTVRLKLKPQADLAVAQPFFEALQMQLVLLSKEFEKTISFI